MKCSFTLAHIQIQIIEDGHDDEEEIVEKLDEQDDDGMENLIIIYIS